MVTIPNKMSYLLLAFYTAAEFGIACINNNNNLYHSKYIFKLFIIVAVRIKYMKKSHTYN